MGYAGLLKGRGHDPDLAIRAGDLCRDGFEHGQTRRVYPVVICDEEAHVSPFACLFWCRRVHLVRQAQATAACAKAGSPATVF